MIAWLLSRKWALYGMAIIAAFAVLITSYFYVDRRGYDRCVADTKATQDAADLQQSIKYNTAQSVLQQFQTGLDTKHQTVTKTIAVSNDQNTPVPVLRDTISGLYDGTAP